MSIISKSNAIFENCNEHKHKFITSLEIAEATGKRHDSILRDIRNLLNQGVAAHNFVEGTYKDANQQDRPCYKLTQKGSLILASGYNAVLREKIIDRWEALETGNATPYYQIPQSFSEALMLAAKQAEQIESQQKQIQAQSNQIAELEKQTEYTRVILQSKSTALVTQIAQDYGMSARKFNAILRDLNIQHKVNNQWILYGKYLNKGYVQSSTFNFTRSDGREDVSMTTEWTQKGRMFLYNTLKSNNILPLIEQ